MKNEEMKAVFAFLDSCPMAAEIKMRSMENYNLEDILRIFESSIGEPLDVIEVGTYRGRSTYFFSAMAPSRTVYSIDIDAENHRYASEFLSGRKNVRLLLGDSLSVLPKLLPTLEFNLAFIDGAHDATHCMCEYLLARRFIRRPGLIVMDDADQGLVAQGSGCDVPWVAKVLGMKMKGRLAYEVVSG